MTPLWVADQVRGNVKRVRYSSGMVAVGVCGCVRAAVVLGGGRPWLYGVGRAYVVCG